MLLCVASLHLIAANILSLVGGINEQKSFACYLPALLGLLYVVKYGLRDSFAGESKALLCLCSRSAKITSFIKISLLERKTLAYTVGICVERL